MCAGLQNPVLCTPMPQTLFGQLNQNNSIRLEENDQGACLQDTCLVLETALHFQYRWNYSLFTFRIQKLNSMKHECIQANYHSYCWVESHPGILALKRKMILSIPSFFCELFWVNSKGAFPWTSTMILNCQPWTSFWCKSLQNWDELIETTVTLPNVGMAFTQNKGK